MSLEGLKTHYRSFLFLLLMLAALGLFIAIRLPVTLFPAVDFPRIMVSMETSPRPTERTAMELTIPVEEVVRRVPGVRNVRSTTSRGKADVNIFFDWNTNMDQATLQINAVIAQIASTLPSDLQLTVRRMDPTSFPILGYSMVSEKTSLVDLYDIARYQMLPLLFGVNGVADVEIVGGDTDEYQVSIDPAKLDALGITLADLSAALTSSNQIDAVGKLEGNYQLNLVVVDAKLQNIKQLNQLPIKISNGSVIPLQDIAKVESATIPGWQRVTADGHDAVIVQIMQQPGSNSIQIAHDIRDKLVSFRTNLPDGVTLSTWYDQSELVQQSATSVLEALVIGVVFAAAVLLFSLRNLRLAIIVAIIIPISLLVTVVAMYLLDVSFNVMSLGGLATGVGLMIDDVIVMSEYIMRKLKGKRESIWGSAREVFPSLLGSSAATIIIFLPLMALSGVTGAFFKTLALVISSGLLVSFLATWLAVPLLASMLLKDTDAEQEDQPIFRKIQDSYSLRLRTFLRTPTLLLVGIIPILFIGLLAYYNVGSGFMPKLDEGGFVLDYKSKAGTALSETDRLVMQVEEIIQKIPELDTYTRRTGAQLGGGLTEADEGDLFIRLKGFPRRHIEEIMQEVRETVENQVPGLDIELVQLMEDMIGDLIGVPQPIEIKIYGDDATKLQTSSLAIVEGLSSISGVVDVRDSINPSGDSIEILIDHAKIALEGMDATSLITTLNTYMDGVVTTNLQGSYKLTGVRLWADAEFRTNERSLKNLQIRSPNGYLFPLSRVATIQKVPGLPQITRNNLRPMIAVTARLNGRDLGSAISDIKAMMAKQNVTYELGGLYEQQQIAFRGLLQVFVGAIALVFLLLLFLFEDFLIAVSIILMPLLALPAVFIGLWITGTELNISSMMGLTMILGIMTEVAIFYFSEYQQLQNQSNAIEQAGRKRLRPIVMTTVATILTLLPLALALGHGSEMHQPLAIAIISGLIVQVPLVLLVMPILYTTLRGHKWT